MREIFAFLPSVIEPIASGKLFFFSETYRVFCEIQFGNEEHIFLLEKRCRTRGMIRHELSELMTWETCVEMNLFMHDFYNEL